MNYVDDGYVIDDLRQFARELNGERLSIYWIPDTDNFHQFNQRVAKSIIHRKEWLPRHLQSHNVEPSCIKEFRTDIFLNKNRQLIVQSYVLDDRGKEYVINVSF
ncbi:MAG: hypothetical protein BalsKO_29280 [Balneolaceae bacterium]